MQKVVPRSCVRIFRNERTRSTTFDPKLTFWCFLYYLGAFWTVWLPYKTWCKNGPNWCKSSCHEVASEFFGTNAPDPPLWTLNRCFGALLFGAFGTVRLPYETWCKIGGTSVKVRATKSYRNFSQRTHPIHPIGP